MLPAASQVGTAGCCALLVVQRLVGLALCNQVIDLQVDITAWECLSLQSLNFMFVNIAAEGICCVGSSPLKALYAGRARSQSPHGQHQQPRHA
jgi:hypothetical protein